MITGIPKEIKENESRVALITAAPQVAQMLIEKKVVGIAYETVQTRDGRLPLLQPMSEVAGRMAIQ